MPDPGDGHPGDLPALLELAPGRDEADHLAVGQGHKPHSGIEVAAHLNLALLNPEPLRQRPSDDLAGGNVDRLERHDAEVPACDGDCYHWRSLGGSGCDSPR